MIMLDFKWYLCPGNRQHQSQPQHCMNTTHKKRINVVKLYKKWEQMTAIACDVIE